MIGLAKTLVGMNFSEQVARARDWHWRDGLDASRPRRHHDHAVGERNGLAEIVGDEVDGLAFFVPQFEQLVLEQQPGLGVQWAEWFIHQYDLRLVDQRADDVGALAHAAGKLMRVAVLKAAETNPVD